MNGITTVAPLGARAALPADGQAQEEQREIRFLGDLQRLQPKPGDVFVLTVDRSLSIEQCEHLRSYWKQVMGDIKVLVLTEGLKLGCMAKPPEA
ncbi:hypothetical protein [Variovorax sp. JS1663]|uniref:hypothetical protein n=1 Tax=Variovorax sp. JS1663 TaxID=1851577 RepID=UPI000B3470AC|nr:hypothetical protein [Variovorax sp. JS1663]OUM00571.1 hypothetical protein A8M77_21135 [Variovorax sp. JS1663]